VRIIGEKSASYYSILNAVITAFKLPIQIVNNFDLTTMSKKNKSSVSIGEGNNCPKCNKPMERREHKAITAKILNQPFYFSEWDYCKPCGHIQMYEYKKVWNKNKKADDYIQRQAEIREYNEQQNFFKNI
jgi:uncharacterized protein with PIN domain